MTGSLDRVKLFLSFWLGGSILAFLGIIAFGQEGLLKDGGNNSAAVTLKKKQLEVDRSFAQIQIQIAEGNLSPDEARDLMSRWFADSKNEIAEVEQLRTELFETLKKEQPPVEMPTEGPNRDELGNQEFVEKVGRYFADSSRAIWDKVDSSDPQAIEDARDQFAEFLRSERSLSLMAQAEEAREEIQASLMRRPPLSQAEIAELSPEEQLEEQIYTKVYEVMFDPVNGPEPIEGDEWRDRFAQLHPVIEETMNQFKRDFPNWAAEKAQQKKNNIEIQLESLRNE